METNNLIALLQADLRPKGPALSMVWYGSVLLSAAIAAAIFFFMIGPRPDFALAAGTLRFLFKFVVTIAFAAGAFVLLQALSRPADRLAGRWLWLAAGPVMLGFAVLLEMLVVPSDLWLNRLIGTNILLCLTVIPLLGVGPHFVFIGVLRYGAPTRPALSGATAGLLAGGLSATFYAANCTDDSPLFVAAWYSIAIGGLVLLGAVSGRFLLRW